MQHGLVPEQLDESFLLNDEPTFLNPVSAKLDLYRHRLDDANSSEEDNSDGNDSDFNENFEDTQYSCLINDDDNDEDFADEDVAADVVSNYWSEDNNIKNFMSELDCNTMGKGSLGTVTDFDKVNDEIGKSSESISTLPDEDFSEVTDVLPPDRIVAPNRIPPLTPGEIELLM